MLESPKTRRTGNLKASNSETRTVLRAILPYVILVVAVYGVTSLLQRRQKQNFLRNDLRMYAMLGSPMGNGVGGGTRGGREGTNQPRLDIKTMEPQPLPRFFATLARNYGDYTISVRQVIGTTYQQNIYNNRATDAPLPPMEQFFVSMQALSPSPKSVQRIKGFDVAIRAVDSAGTRHVGQGTTKVVRFTQGVAQIIQFPAPNPKANKVTLDGDLLLDNKGKEQRLPFHLEMIPLPTQKHAFGTVSLATLTPEQAKQFPVIPDTKSLPVLSEAMAENLAPLFPPHKAEVAPLQLPWRILLMPAVENRFEVYLPQEGKPASQATVQCVVKPSLLADGEITGDISFKRGSGAVAHQKFTVWEDEPHLFLLPRALWDSPNRPIAMRLHLFMDFQNTASSADELPTPMSPFPTSESKRGATLEGTLKVGDTPLDRTIITVEIMPLNENGTSQTLARRVRIFTGKGGRWTIGNFAPGTYRIRLVLLYPQRSDLLPVSRLDAYLERRYGIAKFDIENASHTDVILRSGSRVTLRPWRIVPTTGEGFQLEQPRIARGIHSQPQILKNSSAMMSNRFSQQQDQRR